MEKPLSSSRSKTEKNIHHLVHPSVAVAYGAHSFLMYQDVEPTINHYWDINTRNDNKKGERKRKTRYDFKEMCKYMNLIMKG